MTISRRESFKALTGSIAALAFASAGDTNWLYVVQNGKLYRRPVKVTGANAWTIVKPPKPTL